MKIYEIPLTNVAQTFLCVLSAVEYRFTVRYRPADHLGWVMDIDRGDGTRLVGGIPLVTGADLLYPYGHLGFKGSLIVQTDADEFEVPTYENLGSTAHLYYVEVS